jgi:hypothetical protein
VSPGKIWTKNECLALAAHSCAWCFGLGRRPGKAGNESVCNCVHRSAFRACYARYRKCSAREQISRVSLEANPGKQRYTTYGFKSEEYMADFVLTARRVLGTDTLSWKVFRFHFLYGANWILCTKRLGINRGAFFHEVYRIEQRLGRAYRELEPHALFPVDQYFASK